MSPNRTGLRMYAAAGIAALTLAGAAAAPAQAAPPAPIQLSGAAEVPSNASVATGSFTYKIKGDRFCYTLTASNLQSGATGAHVHAASAGVVGSVVIPLEVDLGSTSFMTADCVEADKALLKTIRSEPSAYYVNVHSQTFPGGEIRAQLG